jgi:hypothetical protein
MIKKYSIAAVAAASALLTAACSAGGGAGPLVSGSNKGEKACAPAPSKIASEAVPAWNSPVGFTGAWYYNPTASPVTVESVSLIGAHNLVLHKTIVYQTRREQNQLAPVNGWPAVSLGSDPASWARRQPVPGAVIAPDPPNAGDTSHNAYQVVVDVTAKTPAGGYAIGQEVTYRQGNAEYTIRSYSGYAISPPGGPMAGTRCQAYWNAISTAWQSS